MPTTAPDMVSHSSVRLRGPAQVIEAVVEDRDRYRDGQRQQHHAEYPAGNAVASRITASKDQRWRAGGHGEKQQLLAD